MTSEQPEQHEPNEAFTYCVNCAAEWPCWGELWNRAEANQAKAYAAEQALAASRAREATLRAEAESAAIRLRTAELELLVLGHDKKYTCPICDQRGAKRTLDHAPDCPFAAAAAPAQGEGGE